jgi:ribosomal-protein-alanine N-acetyltransferase
MPEPRTGDLSSGRRELQTERLLLIPLDAANLRRSIEAPPEMEKCLGLSPRLARPPAEVIEATRQMLDGALNDPKNWLFHTEWQIVLREENCIIGGLCFKGPADRNGQVEVGYGLDPPFRGFGYITEALQALVQWALSQPGVVAVISETGRQNLASQRALRKVGFVRYQETEGFLWWRVSRKHLVARSAKSTEDAETGQS